MTQPDNDAGPVSSLTKGEARVITLMSHIRKQEDPRLVRGYSGKARGFRLQLDDGTWEPIHGRIVNTLINKGLLMKWLVAEGGILSMAALTDAGRAAINEARDLHNQVTTRGSGVKVKAEGVGRRSKQWHEKYDKKIAHKYLNEGVDIPELAKMFKVKPRSVRRILRQQNALAPAKPWPQKLKDAKRVERAKESRRVKS